MLRIKVLRFSIVMVLVVEVVDVLVIGRNELVHVSSIGIRGGTSGIVMTR